MAITKRPLLRGNITATDNYQAPQRPPPSKKPKVPSLDPRAHRASLIKQLDAIASQVKARSNAQRDVLATREIVAVRPAPGVKLLEEQLDDVAADARLVGVIQESGTVLLDVANPDMQYLRDKIEAFGDDSKVVAKTNKSDGSPKLDEHGVQITERASEKAIAPVGSIGLAQFEDRVAAKFPSDVYPDDRPFWFEIGCRGDSKGGDMKRRPRYEYIVCPRCGFYNSTLIDHEYHGGYDSMASDCCRRCKGPLKETSRLLFGPDGEAFVKYI